MRRRKDPLSEAERSAHMARVRSTDNQSTERRVEEVLQRRRITGWEKHRRDVTGTPDFYFPEYRLALFVHGCFWHMCPRCNRRIPQTRREFWRKKLDENRRRDQRVRRALWRNGYHVIRVWEHEVRDEQWVRRLETMIRRLSRAANIRSVDTSSREAGEMRKGEVLS